MPITDLTMQERDYQTLYRLFHSFTACNNKATHSVRAENEVADCTKHCLCYTTDDAFLYLCQECLEFWRECRRLQDRSMWDMAVFLRESRAERQS